MCGCNSNFNRSSLGNTTRVSLESNTSRFNRSMLGSYSNLNSDELRKQCANENGLDVNDPGIQNILDACVAAKKKEKADKAIGWLQAGSNILGNIGGIIGGIFNPQAAPQDMPPAPDQLKKLSTGAIIGIIAAVAVLGLGVYYIAKPKNK